MAEVIKCYREEITITLHSSGERSFVDGPFSRFPRTYTLPDRATVMAEASMHNWGGYKGVTHFINQEPRVRYSGIRVNDNGEETNLLGKMMKVTPDGFYSPPELPQILEQVEKWGWTVTPEVKALVASARPSRSYS